MNERSGQRRSGAGSIGVVLVALSWCAHATPSAEPTDVVRRTTLVVHDVEASVRFYRDVLGFRVWLDNRGSVNRNSLPVDLLEGSPSRFVIMRGQHPWVGMIGLLQYGAARSAPPPRKFVVPGDAVLMIETTDLADIHTRMRQAGTRILRAPETSEVTGAGGERWRATFLFAYDPDGHLLEINQREPPAADTNNLRAVAAPIRRGFFDGRFGQLHYRRFIPAAAVGPRTPVVLLHQTPLSSRMFTELMPKLGVDRVVYAVDTPGYGESDAPPKIPTIADYGDALQDFIAHLREPVDLIGYHTGALVAADIAARYPQSVRKVLLISPPLLDAERLAKLDTATPIMPDGSHVMAGWSSSMATRPEGQTLEQAARLVAEKQRAGSRAGWAMAAIKAHDAAATYRSVRQPAWVVRVADSLRADAEKVAALLPSAAVIDAPPEWRYGMFDAYPDAVATLLRFGLDAQLPPKL